MINWALSDFPLNKNRQCVNNDIKKLTYHTTKVICNKKNVFRLQIVHEMTKDKKTSPYNQMRS